MHQNKLNYFLNGVKPINTQSCVKCFDIGELTGIKKLHYCAGNSSHRISCVFAIDYGTAVKKFLAFLVMTCFSAACTDQSKLEIDQNTVGSPQAQAIDYLRQQNDKKFNNFRPENLKVVSNKTDDLGFTHIRFQQVFKSIPVLHKELWVHINKGNNIYRADENLAAIPDSFSVEPKIAAGDIAKFSVHAMDNDDAWQVVTSQPVVYVDPANKPFLAYYVELTRNLQTEFVILDALDGNLLHQIAGTYTR